MEQPWSLGVVIRCLCGTPPAQTHWHLLIATLPPRPTREAGAVAEEAERRKKAKYNHRESSYCFIPVAVYIETLGVFGPEARGMVKDLGRRIAHATLEPLSTRYLRQRISVAVQRGNAVANLSSISSTGGKLDAP